MKRLLLSAAAAALLCGCASSERMARLSGGVMQKHSAPRTERLRSARFQVTSNPHIHREVSGHNDFSGQTLINIWPFFVRSGDYYSALWPMFDYDPYGMALRPFYNQEGDDHSILFPLSAWNPVSKDGWTVNFYWKQGDFMGLFPLFHQSFREDRGWAGYTPLFIRYWSYDQPVWYRPEKEEVWTQCLLGYYRHVKFIDVSQYRHLRFHNSEYPRHVRELLAWKLRGTGPPVPQNLTEFQEYRKKVFEALPLSEKKYYGFIPLFFGWDLPDEQGFNLVGLLGHWENGKDRGRSWGLFHLLFTGGWSRNDPLDPVENRSYFVMPPLLSYWGKTSYRTGTQWERIKALRFLGGGPFSRRLPEMKNLYREAEGTEMPPELCSNSLWLEWVREYAAKQKTESETESYGGFLPLYCFFAGRKHFFWSSPALLTFSRSGADRRFFLSIPLLTLRTRDKYKDLTTTAGPLIWYSKQRREERIRRQIFSRDVFRVKQKSGKHTFEDEYAFCGLYYHGRDGFTVAREGVDPVALEYVRSRAFELKKRCEMLRTAERRIAKRRERNKNWAAQNRLDELKKMVDAEEIRLEQEKKDKTEKQFIADLHEWVIVSAGFGMAFNRATLEKQNFTAALEKLLDKHTETRFSEDYGSAVFYRKEQDSNGDFDWHVLLRLASGSRRGNRETKQILQFFYRLTREGERAEEVIFPFISVRKDKDFRSFSFLWRMWESHESPQGRGGHLLFFPWGSPEKSHKKVSSHTGDQSPVIQSGVRPHCGIIENR